MTLMPVWNISVLDSSWSNAGALRWIGQRSVISIFSPGLALSRSPVAFQTWPLVTSPTGTLMPSPVSRDGQAADQAVGRLHRDGAHGVVTDVLGDLEDEGARLAVEGEVDLERVVDLGHLLAGTRCPRPGR